MKKGASLYQRGSFLFILPNHRTTKGIWVSGVPVMVIEEGAVDAITIASKVREALSASVYDAPQPSQEQYKILFQPVLDAANVKSWATFMKGTRYVDLILADGAITLTPTRNAGAREGFKFTPAENLVVPDRLEDLVAAIPVALARSE